MVFRFAGAVFWKVCVRVAMPRDLRFRGGHSEASCSVETILAPRSRANVELVAGTVLWTALAG